jgi:hypothetical protein
MSLGRIFTILIGIAIVFALVHYGRDPQRARLPFGSTDLSSVESALRRLPAEERSLVEAYVKRSNGDVLLPSMADPDDPLTARTFGEAIVLQRKWNEHMRAQEAVAATRAAERDRAMAPLREAVSARVSRREILTRDELNERQSPGYLQRAHRVDSDPVFVITVAIDNHTDADIVALQGSLQARDRDAYLPLDLCWVDLNEQRTISAHARSEIICAHPHRNAGPNEREFVADPPGRFTVTWEPKLVRMADGKVLESKL